MTLRELALSRSWTGGLRPFLTRSQTCRCQVFVPSRLIRPSMLTRLCGLSWQRRQGATWHQRPGNPSPLMWLLSASPIFFFPRVRTPCGHGAQVIGEGREEQSDGGEKNKDHNRNPKTTTKGPQAESPPSCSLSSVLGETGETKKSV